MYSLGAARPQTDFSVYSHPSCLSIPKSIPHGLSSHVKQLAGQDPKPCSVQQHGVQHVSNRRKLFSNDALSVVAPGATGNEPHLGWLHNFTAKYTLGPVLGRGSFGTVHEAVHNQSGNSYAVKVLRKVGRNGGIAHIDAIKQEVATWTQAQGSKFVARLEGLYEDDHNAYIVQELCPGGDLKSLLEANGCFSELETATIMRGVLDVLAECHRRDICYGDVKPANFLLATSTPPAVANSPKKPSAPRLSVRAVDFGCSRMVREHGLLRQQCGTPLYMAPEMALQRFGQGVDVWAAGIMMYQMLTGKTPFWPNKTMAEISKLPTWEVMAAVRTHEVSFPSAVWRQWSPQAKDLVQHMLDRNPATRISAEEALAHPWFQEMLGYTPSLSGQLACNNVVGFPHHHHFPAHGSAEDRAHHDRHGHVEGHLQRELEALLAEGVPQLSLPSEPSHRSAGCLQARPVR